MTAADPNNTELPAPGPAVTRKFSPMLTMEQVKDILNVGLPTVSALLNSGELRGMQIGGRKMWRISEADLETYIERCYQRTEENIAADNPPTESSTP